MPTYRAYILNPAGRILSGHWIEADTVEEAEAQARALCAGGTSKAELWLGARKISDIECDIPERQTALRKCSE